MRKFEDKFFKRSSISFLDFPKLIGTASHGVFITPEEIAEKFNLYIEQSFSEQLGIYSFVAFEFEGHQFGCRRYHGSPKTLGVMVGVLGAKPKDKAGLIARALDVDLDQVHYIDGEW